MFGFVIPKLQLTTMRVGNCSDVEMKFPKGLPPKN